MGGTVRKVTRRQALALVLGAATSAVGVACGSARPGPDALGAGQAPPVTPGVRPSTPLPTMLRSSTVLPTALVDPSAVAAAHDGRVPMQWGLGVDGVHNQLADPGSSSAPTLALTFDACGGAGGSGVDQELLDVLTGSGVPATLFLNLRWIEANRSVAERLVANPLFELGNHGSRHLPLSVDGRGAYGIAGTQSAAEVADEVWVNHELLTELTGTPPRWFRSGTAHYDEVATTIAIALGEQPVGFTTNGDLGATATSSQVRAELLSAPAGGIVIAHMNQPGSGTAAGVASSVTELGAAGTRFVTVGGGGGTRV